MKSRLAIILTLLALILTSLACTIFVGGPDYPQTQIPASTQAVTRFDDQLHAAEQSAAQTGVFTLTINEEQLTSLLASKLATQDSPLISDPQVVLQDNEIQVYGKVVQGNLQANARVVLSASIDADGKPQLTVTSADFGPLPAPTGLNDAIGTMIDQTFTGALGPAAIGFRLEKITIADGTMTVSGRVK